MTTYAVFAHWAGSDRNPGARVYLRFEDARTVVVNALTALQFLDAARVAGEWEAPAESIEIQVDTPGYAKEAMVWGVEAKTEMDYVTDHASRLAEHEPIGHTAARMVAAWWQAPARDGLPFARLQSTGAIEDADEFCAAIDRTIDQYARHGNDARRDVGALMSLKAYVNFHGERPPLRWWTTATSY
jgi:hypothetical protein